MHDNKFHKRAFTHLLISPHKLNAQNIEFVHVQKLAHTRGLNQFLKRKLNIAS